MRSSSIRLDSRSAKAASTRGWMSSSREWSAAAKASN